MNFKFVNMNLNLEKKNIEIETISEFYIFKSFKNL